MLYLKCMNVDWSEQLLTKVHKCCITVPIPTLFCASVSVISFLSGPKKKKESHQTGPSLAKEKEDAAEPKSKISWQKYSFVFSLPLIFFWKYLCPFHWLWNSWIVLLLDVDPFRPGVGTHGRKPNKPLASKKGRISEKSVGIGVADMFQAEAVEEYCFKNGHYSIYTVRLQKKWIIIGSKTATL